MGRVFGAVGAIMVAIQTVAIACVLADLNARPTKTRRGVATAVAAILMILSPWLMLGLALVALLLLSAK
jgi:hypothetical protein